MLTADQRAYTGPVEMIDWVWLPSPKLEPDPVRRAKALQFCAVPDGVRDSFTPSVAATKFPAGLWQCRHCTPAARLGLGTAVWCRQSSLVWADG